MANIATTATVIDHSSDAAFRTWVAEIISTFTSTLTLVQTSDTGQINTSTVTRPGVINTSAGYAIFRFSDTLQATAPVFIRIDFGNLAGTTQPGMWVQIGTSTNGAGTITGTKTLTQTVNYPLIPTSTTTSYTSRFVCNMTLGYVGLAWKLGGSGTATAFYGGFQIYRSNDTSGNPSGDSVQLISNSSPQLVTAFPTMFAGVTSSMGYEQCLSYSSLLIYPPTPSNGNLWYSSGGNSTTPLPFNITSTSVSGNAQVFPVVYMAPVLNYSAFNCYGLLAEQPLGTTFTAALVGSTPLTFISIGQPWGNSYLGSVSTNTAGYNMLWQ